MTEIFPSRGVLSLSPSLSHYLSLSLLGSPHHGKCFRHKENSSSLPRSPLSLSFLLSPFGVSLSLSLSHDINFCREERFASLLHACVCVCKGEEEEYLFFMFHFPLLLLPSFLLSFTPPLLSLCLLASPRDGNYFRREENSLSSLSFCPSPSFLFFLPLLSSFSSTLINLHHPCPPLLMCFPLLRERRERREKSEDRA